MQILAWPDARALQDILQQCFLIPQARPKYSGILHNSLRSLEKEGVIVCPLKRLLHKKFLICKSNSKSALALREFWARDLGR